MSSTKPATPKDTEPPKRRRLPPTDFPEFAAATAAGLGDGWAVDTDSKPGTGPSAYLAHPDGRRIGVMYLWRGEAVQTWALDVPRREFEEGDRDAESYAESLTFLTPGIRYNVGVCFTDKPPAETTAQDIRTRLLPAFGGKRPALRAFPKKRDRAAATEAATSEAAAETPPKRAASRTAKKAQPSTTAPEPKKREPARRTRRAKTTQAQKTAEAAPSN
ncbi:hypothetical protein [Streptomyces sp. NPDC058084]|uniref:hypothetical protein n=1 Tax=Streptomyces sp. NPDC058084 TaxID=3346333 RepID=UPI0036EBD36C